MAMLGTCMYLESIQTRAINDKVVKKDGSKPGMKRKLCMWAMF